MKRKLASDRVTRVHRRLRSGPAAVIVLLLGLLWPIAVSADEKPAGGEGVDATGAPLRRSWALTIVESRLRTTFDDVSHLSTIDLARLLDKDPDRVVLLDVRGADEYAVSRIPGAIRIDPESRSAGEVAQLAGDLTDKIVIAYCAIGLRSSQLIVRIGQALKEKGPRELHNLEGGAFRWRNERRGLVGPDGQTRAIHPYSLLWRQFLLDDPGER